jgi:hypothetical protein
MPPVQHGDRPPHLISPNEVANWLSGSANHRVTYHRTSTEAAERIRRLGIDPERSRVGSFGCEFYTATVEEEEYGPDGVAVAIRLMHPLTGRFADVEEL